MFTVALFLLAGWLVALSVFHVTTAFVHLLLLMAVFAFVWHMRDRSRQSTS